MLQILSNQITSFFISHELLDNKYKEWCEYIVHKNLLTTCILLISFFGGCFFAKPYEVVSFYSFFTLIRRYGGGYHAKSEFMCFTASILVFLLSVFFIEYFFTNKYLIYVLLFFSGLLILIIGSVNHPNMNLSKRELLLCSRKTLACFLFESLVIFIFSFLNLNTSAFMAFGTATAAFSMLLAKIIKQEVPANEDQKSK